MFSEKMDQREPTMEDVQEWLMNGLEMVLLRDEAFVQAMEALNLKKSKLVEAEQRREKKFKVAKDNLVMLENVRREKEMEVMKLHRVFSSLPRELLVAAGAEDKVTPAGDSFGVKRKLGGCDQQFLEERKAQSRQPSTPINKFLPKSRPQLSHESHASRKKKCGEVDHQQLCPSRDQLSTPIKVLRLAHDPRYVYGSKDRTMQLSTNRTPFNKVPTRSRPQLPHEFLSRDQLLTPNNKMPPKSQLQLSHDSYQMKRKLGEHGSRDHKRQNPTPLNEALTRPCNSQSWRSGAGGVMQVLIVDFPFFKGALTRKNIKKINSNLGETRWKCGRCCVT